MPDDAFAARVRENLSVRRQGLEEACPEALDLAVAVLVTLHRGIVGRQEALRGDRSGSYFRRQLRGEDALAAEDLARLAVEAPTALAPALTILKSRVDGAGRTSGFVTPIGACSALAQHAVATLGKLADFIQDGHLDADELAQLEIARARIRTLDVELGAAIGRASGSIA